MYKTYPFILFVMLAAPCFAEQVNDDKLNGIWQGSFDINGNGPFDFTAIHVDGQSTAVSHAAKTLCTGEVELDKDQYMASYQLYALDGAPFDEATILGELRDGLIESQFVTKAAGDTGVLKLQYNEIYEQPSSLDMVEGEWKFIDRDGLEISWSVQAGEVVGKDSDNCKYKGAVSVIDPQFNAYLVEVNVSQCASVSGEYRGLAYLEQGEQIIFRVDIAGSFYGFHFDLEKLIETARVQLK